LEGVDRNGRRAAWTAARGGACPASAVVRRRVWRRDRSLVCAEQPRTVGGLSVLRSGGRPYRLRRRAGTSWPSR